MENGPLLKDLIKDCHQRLTKAFDAQESQALTRELFLRVKGWTPVEMAVKADDHVSLFLASEIDRYIERLLNHEPIQYIFGICHFYGMDFKVSEATLIPRQDTAMLVDIIVKQHDNKSDLKVFDLATGSGCIAIALARNLPFSSVDAIDISPDAIDVAMENNQRLKTDVHFYVSDVFALEPFYNAYDIIVSNPPYITESEKREIDRNVLEYEPSEALFVSDENPLVFYKSIAKFAFASLKPDGFLYLEINNRFVKEIVSLLKENGFINIEAIKYIDRNPRFVIAQKPNND